LFLDGPISYSIPQGDRRSYDIQFFDETYDGYNENGTLKGKAYFSKYIISRYALRIILTHCVVPYSEYT